MDKQNNLKGVVVEFLRKTAIFWSLKPKDCNNKKTKTLGEKLKNENPGTPKQ